MKCNMHKLRSSYLHKQKLKIFYILLDSNKGLLFHLELNLSRISEQLNLLSYKNDNNSRLLKHTHFIISEAKFYKMTHLLYR